MPGLAAPLGIEEVIGERPRVSFVEPERPQPLERIGYVRQGQSLVSDTGSEVQVRRQATPGAGVLSRRNGSFACSGHWSVSDTEFVKGERAPKV